MSLAQQKQINLLKDRVEALEKQNSQQGNEIVELNRKMDLLLNKFETTMAKAIEKVIGDGLELEQTTESQIRELIQ